MAKKNRRRIDESVGKVSGNMKSKFLLVPSVKIKTWKALIIVVFVAGFFAALVWSAMNSWYVGSSAAKKIPKSKAELSASITSGVMPLAGVKFSAKVSSDIGKNISYQFFCDFKESDNTWTPDPDVKYVKAGTTQEIPDVCNKKYSQPGIYTAKVIVSGMAKQNGSMTTRRAEAKVKIKVLANAGDDLDAPVLSAGALTASKTKQTKKITILENATLSLKTNEKAICRFAKADLSFDNMGSFFSKNYQTEHSKNLGTLFTPDLKGKNIKFFVKCKDERKNTNDSGYPIEWKK